MDTIDICTYNATTNNESVYETCSSYEKVLCYTDR